MKTKIFISIFIGVLILSAFMTSCKKTTPDTVVPVVTINGLQKCFLQKGRPYIDDNATAIDDQDGTLNPVSSGMVNPSVIGTYRITYTATDQEGNKGTAERIVYVVDLEGSYQVMNITPYPATAAGDTTYFGDYLFLAESMDGQLNFSNFGGYSGAAKYSYVTNYTNINIPSSIVNCGAPALDRMFSGSGTISNTAAPHTKLTVNYKEVSDTTLISRAIYTKD